MSVLTHSSSDHIAISGLPKGSAYAFGVLHALSLALGIQSSHSNPLIGYTSQVTESYEVVTPMCSEGFGDQSLHQGAF